MTVTAAALPAVAALLRAGRAVVLRRHWDPTDCAAMADRVLAARPRWTADFGGEQFTLGRAFYTHLETGRAGEYFAAAAEADRCVDAVLPGAQARARALYAAAVGGAARPRPGFCGAGVQVFLPRSRVARRGGVAHWDVEGLAPAHLAGRRRAVSLVVMLRAPARGAALTLWDAHYDGGDEPSPEALAAPRRTVRYGPGDALLFSSYRLHRIRGFRGESPRVAVTLHGVEVDRGVWETWY